MVYTSKGQWIAGNSQRPVAILGNPTTADFEVVALIDKTESLECLVERLKESIAERGLVYLATVGLVDGKPVSSLEEPLDTPTLEAMSAAYLAHIQPLLDRALEVVVLQRLHELPDPRPS